MISVYVLIMCFLIKDVVATCFHYQPRRKCESNELQGDCLDFLVNFCNQAKEAGLLDDMFSEKEDKDVS